MKKISVLGSPGTGKTTFSRAAAAKLQLEHIELDKIYWLPDWQKPSDLEFREKLAAAVAQAEARNPNGWVMCGNYTRILSGKYQSLADHVILLQPPIYIPLWRVIKRSLVRIVRREEVFDGCQETFSGVFVGKNSLLGWVLLLHGKREALTRSLMRQLNRSDKLLVFRSNDDAFKWLSSQ